MSGKPTERSRVSRRRFIEGASAGSVVALAGCTGGQDTDGDSGGSTGGSGPIQLTYWHQEAPPQRQAMFEEFTERFNAEHDDIQVEVQGQNWGSVFSKLTSALEAGNPPDFIFSLPAFTMDFQARGELVDVTDIVEDINSEHDMYQSAISPFQYQGGTWGIPMWDMVFLNHYRTDTLGQTSVWPPQNWDEWLQASTEVTGDGQYGTVMPASSTLWTTENIYTLMVNNDSYVYGPDGNVMFDTPETVEVLDFYKRMYEQSSPDTTSWSWGEWETSILRGTAHSTIGFSSWMRRLVDTEFADNFSAMPQPYPEGGSPGSIHYVNDIMVFNEEKKDAIGTFIKWMHSEAVYGDWLAKTEPTLYLPVTKTGEESEDFWNHPVVSRYEPSVRAQFEALPDARIYGFRDIHVENDLYIPSVGLLESSNVLADVVQELVVNDRTPAEAATWGQETMQELLGLEPSSSL